MRESIMPPRAAKGRRTADLAPQPAAEPRPQLSALADALNARPAVQQLRAMSAALTQGRRTDAVFHGLAGQGTEHPVQRVHPAYNSFNYWRLPMPGEKSPHPATPEGKMLSLSEEFGAEIAKLILYTDLKEDDALQRERMTRDFYESGGSLEKASKWLTLHSKDNDALYRTFKLDRFEQGVRLGGRREHPA